MRVKSLPFVGFGKPSIDIDVRTKMGGSAAWLLGGVAHWLHDRAGVVKVLLVIIVILVRTATAETIRNSNGKDNSDNDNQ